MEEKNELKELEQINNQIKEIEKNLNASIEEIDKTLAMQDEGGEGKELLENAKQLQLKAENMDDSSSEDLQKLNAQLESLIDDISKLNKKE